MKKVILEFLYWFIGLFLGNILFVSHDVHTVHYGFLLALSVFIVYTHHFKKINHETGRLLHKVFGRPGRK